jgi:hypothetical protein
MLPKDRALERPRLIAGYCFDAAGRAARFRPRAEDADAGMHSSVSPLL